MSFQPWAFDRLHYFFLLFTQHHRYGRHFIRSSQFKLHLMHKYYVMLLISYGPNKRIINNVLETAGIVHFFVLFILIIWNGDQEGRSVMQCWPKAVCFWTQLVHVYTDDSAQLWCLHACPDRVFLFWIYMQKSRFFFIHFCYFNFKGSSTCEI